MCSLFVDRASAASLLSQPLATASSTFSRSFSVLRYAGLRMGSSVGILIRFFRGEHIFIDLSQEKSFDVPEFGESSFFWSCRPELGY